MIGLLLTVYIGVYFLIVLYACFAPSDPKWGRKGTIYILSIFGLLWPLMLVALLGVLWDLYMKPWIKSQLT